MAKRQKQNDLDFGIQFVEAILKTTPNFIEALIALGDLYTKKGFYQKGLEIDLRLSLIRPDDPYILYNLACSYSLLSNLDEALSTLKSAIECGYDHYEFLQYDTDLANLREDIRFRELISDLINRKVNPSTTPLRK